ncbi:serine protease [Clostridium polyendosporum]|uniref:Serine protease n=1 Tax=Clostridium polyendosporum TaxID=69208 RepID=A0A919S123_9CLOT|nr:S53 family peptidase [Clostridium polyendosporum]GIM29857.1 serine protease [Clostridium polyendosporum]
MKKKIVLFAIICISIVFLINLNIHKDKSINNLNAYKPYQIMHAYGIDQLNVKGRNQKIAVIVPYGSSTIEKDLEIFNSQFNLEPANLKIFYPQGEAKTQNYSWALETSLDVEWIHALAPKASIFLIVAKSDSTSDLLSAIKYTTDMDVNIVSMSWAINEFNEETSYESYFKNKNITFIASAGDNSSGINWPAVSPNVLAVGGTTFSLDSKGNLISPETGWSESSGGISKYMPEPKYQIDYGINTNGYRAIPDVSFYADELKGVAVYCSPVYNNQTGWTTLAGTSLGAPSWAAFIALVNEENNTPITNIHDKLYKLAKNKEQYSINFRDITSGNTNLNNTNKGYDYVTGLGSPLENNLYKTLIENN